MSDGFFSSHSDEDNGNSPRVKNVLPFKRRASSLRSQISLSLNGSDKGDNNSIKSEEKSGNDSLQSISSPNQDVNLTHMLNNIPIDATFKSKSSPQDGKNYDHIDTKKIHQQVKHE